MLFWHPDAERRCAILSVAAQLSGNSLARKRTPPVSMSSWILNPHKPPYGAIQQFDSLGMMKMPHTPIITALWHQKHDMKGANMDSDPQSSAAPIINII